MKRKSKRNVSVVVALLVIVGAGLVVRLVLVPKLATPEGPEGIEKRWAKVKTDAGPEVAPAAEAKALLHAAQSLRHSEVKDPPVDRATLMIDQTDALDALEQWAEAKPNGFGAPCPAEPPLPLFGVGRVAVAVRDDPKAAPAALQLAAQMRNRGGMLWLMMGAAIVDAAHKAGVKIPDDLKPTAKELRAALARDAVCFDANLPPATVKNGVISGETISVHEYWLKQLDAVNDAGDDFEAIAKAVAPPPKDQWPASPTVRAVMVDYSGQVRNYAEVVKGL